MSATSCSSAEGGARGGLPDPMLWRALLERWALAGQTMLARFQALNQLGMLGGLDNGAAPDLSDYDDAFEFYIDQLRENWTATMRSARNGERDFDRRSSARHDFVSQLVADPSDPPATLLFVGFAGNASDVGHTRYYVDPGLTAYVEVPDEMVLHVLDLPASQAPLGGQYVWVHRDASVVDQLHEAVAEAARVQHQIWNTGTNGDRRSDTALSPFPAHTPFGAVATADRERPATAAAAFDDDDDDIPLPPGWP